jgi:hypothetical protein
MSEPKRSRFEKFLQRRPLSNDLVKAEYKANNRQLENDGLAKATEKSSLFENGEMKKTTEKSSLLENGEMKKTTENSSLFENGEILTKTTEKSNLLENGEILTKTTEKSNLLENGEIQLSEGMLKKHFDGTITKLLFIDLQVLEVGRTKSNKRFKITVSDGQYKTSWAGLNADALADLRNQKFKELDVIRIVHYDIMELPTGRNILAINRIMDIIHCNQLIGNPNFFYYKNSFSGHDADEFQVENKSEERNITTPAEVNSTTATNVDTGQLSTTTLPTLTAETTATAVVSIKSLNTSNVTKAVIHCHVTNSGVKTWSNKSSHGCFLDFTFVDFSGQIRAVCFNNDCKLFSQLKEGDYKIKNFKVVAASDKYKIDPNQRFEIRVTSNTEFMPIKILLPFNKVQFEQGQITSFFAFVEVHTGKQMLLRANDDKHIIDWIDTCKKINENYTSKVINVRNVMVIENVSSNSLTLQTINNTELSLNSETEGRKMKAEFLSKKFKKSY